MIQQGGLEQNMADSPKQMLALRKHKSTRERLLRNLSNVNDFGTLKILWAVNALQSDNPPDVRPFLAYPDSAAGARLGNNQFMPKWELENLLLLLLSTPKTLSNRVAPEETYQKFDTARMLINLLKAAEAAEETRLIDNSNILNFMQKLGHKQFAWQRGFFSIERMYRYYYVYGQGNCASYFEAQHGLTMDEFAMSCLALHVQTFRVPWNKPPDASALKPMRPEAIGLTLDLISKELTDQRSEAQARIHELTQNSEWRVSYLPSTLRFHPIISSSLMDRYIAPLPQLIMFRATSGLYYDLVSGPQSLIAEATDRFEAYGKKLIEARCPRFSVMRESEYGPKLTRARTPDLLLKDEGTIKVVFECKATKLTFAAQYADDPLAQAPKGFSQIAKGMSQLWKFFSRARRRIYSDETVAPDAYGVILTMDSWFHLEDNQLPALRAEAEALLVDEPDMLPEDKRDVIFCSIGELDDLLAVSTEDEVLETLAKTRLPEFRAWQLTTIRNPGYALTLPARKFPFKVGEVIPLWGAMHKANGREDT